MAISEDTCIKQPTYLQNGLDKQKEKIREIRERQLRLSESYVPGRFIPGYFSVSQRDTHHFDIFAPRRPGYVQWYYNKNPDEAVEPMNDRAQERAFAIRGEPGNIYLRDERWDIDPKASNLVYPFPSVESAMAFVVATLLIGTSDG